MGKKKESIEKCRHPPERNFAWVSYDDVLWVGCCVCGEIVQSRQLKPAKQVKKSKKVDKQTVIE